MAESPPYSRSMDGRRTWGRSRDPGVFEEMLNRETCSRRARLKDGVLLELEKEVSR